MLYGLPVYTAKSGEMTDCTVIEFGTFELYRHALVPIELTKEENGYWDFEDALDSRLK